MRSIDPATGKPFPRKRPVKWTFVARAIAHRRERRQMKQAGFVERGILQDTYGPHMGKRIVEAVPSADGQSIFIKVVDSDGRLTDLAPPAPAALQRPAQYGHPTAWSLNYWERAQLGLIPK